MKRHSILAVAAVPVSFAAVAVGCGGGGAGAPTSAAATTSAPPATTAAAADAETAGPSPCSLLRDAEVAVLLPGAGHGKLDTVPGGTRICNWPNEHGIPAVQLQVTPRPSGSLRDDLENGLGAEGGYTVMSVPDLADEAAAAFQDANPSIGTEAGLAMLSARSGSQVVSLATPLVSVQQGSPEFAAATGLVELAVDRLVGGG